MNLGTRINLRWPLVVSAAVALLAVGAGATYLALRAVDSSRARTDEHAGMSEATPGGNRATDRPVGAPTLPATVAVGVPLPDVTITLSPDAIERAGIVVTPVQSGTASTGLRLPGLVEPNAYRQVVVTPLVAGRVTSVSVQLGEHVRRGQTMAQIFSPELADAQTRYISARAELQAHEQELHRTEKLVEIGAASRQELERIHAEHTARTADVGSARTRLQLLGLSAAQIDALAPDKNIGASTNVPAPIAGVVTERLANVGLNVDLATTLFTVVDLSSVWVLADLYEKDFSRVRVGSLATMTTTAYPGLVLQGRVSYIDPQVSPQTRTARLRVEVLNRGNQLRLGMYTDVMIDSPGAAAVPMIPTSAVQTVGDRQVVYLVNPTEPGTFTEREVRVGGTSRQHVEVLSGTKPGDIVVAEGSFFLRAERERLGLRRGTSATAPHGGGLQPEIEDW